jgi:hypothetical protein
VATLNRAAALLRRLDRTAAERQRGVELVTIRLRQMVDELESATADQDELALARLVAPALLARLGAHGAELARGQVRWRPQRQGLRWAPSDRASSAEGHAWFRVRFEDLTTHFGPQGLSAASGETWELELEVDTTTSPWRLWRALEMERR